MHLRKLRLQQTCKKYGEALKAPELLRKKNTLIWDTRDQLIYCRIAKVGSLLLSIYRSIYLPLCIFLLSCTLVLSKHKVIYHNKKTLKIHEKIYCMLRLSTCFYAWYEKNYILNMKLMRNQWQMKPRILKKTSQIQVIIIYYIFFVTWISQNLQQIKIIFYCHLKYFCYFH